MRTPFFFSRSVAILGFAFCLLFAGTTFSEASTTALSYIWDAASGPVDHYDVYLSTNNAGFQFIGSASETAYTLENAVNLSTYQIKVQAVDAHGNKGPFSDTSDPLTLTLPIDMQLSPGYHIIALPYTPTKPVRAHNFIREHGFRSLACWDASRQAWKSVMRLPNPFGTEDIVLGNNFVIDPLMGVFVDVDTDTTLTFEGNAVDLTQGVGIKTGQNLIALPDLKNQYTAYDMIGMFSAQQVTGWHSETQALQAVQYAGGNYTGDNFAIEIGHGYFVESSYDMVWTPIAPAAPGRPTFVNTPQQLPEPVHVPMPVFGKVFNMDGTTVAYQADVTLTVLRKGVAVANNQGKVDENGYFLVDLPKVQTGDEIRVTVRSVDGAEGVYAPIHIAATGEPQFIGELVLRNVRPEVSRLLTNYPNPFNPETWIPFQIQKDTNVKLYIHDVSGNVVRTIHLGFRAAGYYTSKTQAAYWDGKNNIGERIASGVYFYTLEADDFRSTRKMVVMK